MDHSWKSHKLGKLGDSKGDVQSSARREINQSSNSAVVIQPTINAERTIRGYFGLLPYLFIWARGLVGATNRDINNKQYYYHKCDC